MKGIAFAFHFRNRMPAAALLLAVELTFSTRETRRAILPAALREAGLSTTVCVHDPNGTVGLESVVVSHCLISESILTAVPRISLPSPLQTAWASLAGKVVSRRRSFPSGLMGYIGVAVQLTCE